jgi:SpoVK/Ycf46/Vps4 family AAA+-type ATPase
MNVFIISMVFIGTMASTIGLFLFSQYLYEIIKNFFEERRRSKAEIQNIAELNASNKNEPIFNENLVKESLDKLNSMEGLLSIKQEMTEIVDLIKFDIEEGLFDNKSAFLHMAFLGNPGTGKTTVARIIADIYRGLGILKQGHLVEVDRSSLVAQYIGHTAVLTKSRVESAFGGILFIDEAYNLVGRGHTDFGIEAVDTILKMMEDHRGEFIVVVAGYEELMMQFLNSNPGLKSRFDKIFRFNDHSTVELWKVCKDQFELNGKSLDDDSKEVLLNYIEFISENRDSSFGNSRELRKIVNEVIKNQKLRLAKIPKSDRTEEIKSKIILQDVEEFKEIEKKYNKLIGYK